MGHLKVELRHSAVRFSKKENLLRDRLERVHGDAFAALTLAAKLKDAAKTKATSLQLRSLEGIRLRLQSAETELNSVTGNISRLRSPEFGFPEAILKLAKEAAGLVDAGDPNGNGHLAQAGSQFQYVLGAAQTGPWHKELDAFMARLTLAARSLAQLKDRA